MVVRRAGSHVRRSLHHQRHGVHALDRGGAVEASGTTLLRHRDDGVWAGRRHRRPDRGDTVPGLFVIFFVLGEFLVPH